MIRTILTCKQIKTHNHKTTEDEHDRKRATKQAKKEPAISDNKKVPPKTNHPILLNPIQYKNRLLDVDIH